MIDIKKTADEVDMIINGYAFTRIDKGIKVLNLNFPSSAALLSVTGDVLETSMDDIETKIVCDCFIENIQYMEN